jgi:hypothetical protein
VSDEIRRDALERDIGRRMALCGFDELRVLDVLLGRLELGRHRYGELDLSKTRDYEREEAEELLDMRVYQACQVIVERDRRTAEIEALLEEQAVAL